LQNKLKINTDRVTRVGKTRPPCIVRRAINAQNGVRLCLFARNRFFHTGVSPPDIWASHTFFHGNAAARGTCGGYPITWGDCERACFIRLSRQAERNLTYFLLSDFNFENMHEFVCFLARFCSVGSWFLI